MLRRGQHVAMIDPRVGGFLRVLQARANPGEPHRAELGVGFTQKNSQTSQAELVISAG